MSIVLQGQMFPGQIVVQLFSKAIYSNIVTNYRKDSEQTKQIEELQKQNEDLTEEKERLLEEIERIVSDPNTWSPRRFLPNSLY